MLPAIVRGRLTFLGSIEFQRFQQRRERRQHWRQRWWCLPGRPSAGCSCSTWAESPAKLPCSSQAFELTPAQMVGLLVVFLTEGERGDPGQPIGSHTNRRCGRGPGWGWLKLQYFKCSLKLMTHFVAAPCTYLFVTPQNVPLINLPFKKKKILFEGVL